MVYFSFSPSLSFSPRPCRHHLQGSKRNKSFFFLFNLLEQQLTHTYSNVSTDKKYKKKKEKVRDGRRVRKDDTWRFRKADRDKHAEKERKSDAENAGTGN